MALETEEPNETLFSGEDATGEAAIDNVRIPLAIEDKRQGCHCRSPQPRRQVPTKLDTDLLYKKPQDTAWGSLCSLRNHGENVPLCSLGLEIQLDNRARSPAPSLPKLSSKIDSTLFLTRSALREV